MTTTYTGECPKCGYEQTREWRGEPWRGSDGETSFAADCHVCGPGHELQMFREEPEDEIVFRSPGGSYVAYRNGEIFDYGTYTDLVVKREAAS